MAGKSAAGVQAAVTLADLLEVAGYDWVKGLLDYLPAKGRLALFRSNKQLARVVVRNARRIKLCLTTVRRPSSIYEQPWEQKQAVLKMVKRRLPCIKALLTGCQNIEVEINTCQLQPCPSSLCGSITTLIRGHKTSDRGLDMDVAAKNMGVYKFNTMPKLQVLSLGNGTTDKDVNLLCEALKAGQLPCLYSLTLMPESLWGDAALTRLAAEAGGQITFLKTSCVKLLCELPKFTKLQTLAAYNTSDLSDAMVHICEHPTVQQLTLGNSNRDSDLYFSKDCSKLSCSWKVLVLHCVRVDLFIKLPLSSIPEVRFLHELGTDHKNEAGLQAVLDLPSIKAVCLPDPVGGKGVFHLGGWSDKHIQFIPKIEGAHTLEFPTAWKPPATLPDAWAAIPTHITHIKFSNYTSQRDEPLLPPLWHGFPTHVLSFTLEIGSQFSQQQVLQLVKNVPSHLQRFTLEGVGQASRGSFVNDLYLAAPRHLRLVVKPWGVAPDH